MDEDDGYLQVFTTIDRSADAEKISKLLVKKRLVACAQVLGPITSTYWWEGKMEESKEFLLLLKTKERLFPQVETVIKENHPYDVPEIVAVPITHGSEKYLKWIDEEVQG
jgi:periplasmic divalent cation tolerance protein